jgi:hypothetical protein
VLYEAPIKRPISLKILLDFRDMMTVTLERRGFEVADVQSMKLPNVNNCRPYEQPVLRKRTSEQAHTFLVGHAFIGDKGAKERKKQFSSQNGNCRTQAARAMNEHATAAHAHPITLPRDAQMWHAR